MLRYQIMQALMKHIHSLGLVLSIQLVTMCCLCSCSFNYCS